MKRSRSSKTSPPVFHPKRLRFTSSSKSSRSVQFSPRLFDPSKRVAKGLSGEVFLDDKYAYKTFFQPNSGYEDPYEAELRNSRAIKKTGARHVTVTHVAHSRKQRVIQYPKMAMTLHDVLKDPRTTIVEMKQLRNQAAEITKRFHESLFTHNDLHVKNIMVNYTQSPTTGKRKFDLAIIDLARATRRKTATDAGPPKYRHFYDDDEIVKRVDLYIQKRASRYELGGIKEGVGVTSAVAKADLEHIALLNKSTKKLSE